MYGVPRYPSEGILDQSAIAYARAKGIGIARLMPHGQIIHTAHDVSGVGILVLSVLVILLNYWSWQQVLVGLVKLLLLLVVLLLAWQQTIGSDWKRRKREQKVLQALMQGDFVSNEKEFYGLTSIWEGFFTLANFFRSEVADILNH